MSSSDSLPIAPHAFAQALKNLALESVYLKAAELQNSISHLLDSNIQMFPFAEDGDEVCREAIEENSQVIARMEERVRLCKVEIEGRGASWEAHGITKEDREVNGHGDVDGVAVNDVGEVVQITDGRRPPASGSLTDEELRRRLEAQMAGEEDDEGVHL